jgi:hypothetical protein
VVNSKNFARKPRSLAPSIQTYEIRIQLTGGLFLFISELFAYEVAPPVPPLGYEVRDRKLVVQEADAERVRRIFRRFTELKSATLLARELVLAGERNRYDHLLDKGVLYRLLNNRVYIGEAVHKGTSYPGEHKAIIDRKIWDILSGQQPDNIDVADLLKPFPVEWENQHTFFVVAAPSG